MDTMFYQKLGIPLKFFIYVYGQLNVQFGGQ